MSAKAVAKCFWHREVEEELLEQGLREKWVFTDLTEVANIWVHMMMLWSLWTETVVKIYTLTIALTTAKKKVLLQRLWVVLH